MAIDTRSAGVKGGKPPRKASAMYNYTLGQRCALSHDRLGERLLTSENGKILGSICRVQAIPDPQWRIRRTVVVLETTYWPVACLADASIGPCIYVDLCLVQRGPLDASATRPSVLGNGMGKKEQVDKFSQGKLKATVRYAENCGSMTRDGQRARCCQARSRETVVLLYAVRQQKTRYIYL